MVSKYTISLFSHYVCMAVAGGKKGQLAVVGEEEVCDRLYFWGRRQWGGWGDLTVIEQGFRGIDLGKGLHEFISDSHRLQGLALAVSILLFLAAAWTHDWLLLYVCKLGQCLPFHVVYHAEQLFWFVLSCVYITPYHLHNTSHYAMHLLQALWYKHNTT